MPPLPAPSIRPMRPRSGQRRGLTRPKPLASCSTTKGWRCQWPWQYRSQRPRTSSVPMWHQGLLRPPEPARLLIHSQPVPRPMPPISMRAARHTQPLHTAPQRPQGACFIDSTLRRQAKEKEGFGDDPGRRSGPSPSVARVRQGGRSSRKHRSWPSLWAGISKRAAPPGRRRTPPFVAGTRGEEVGQPAMALGRLAPDGWRRQWEESRRLASPPGRRRRRILPYLP